LIAIATCNGNHNILEHGQFSDVAIK